LEIKTSGETNFDFESDEQAGGAPIPDLGVTDAVVEKGRFTYHDVDSGDTVIIGVDLLKTDIPGLMDPVQLDLQAIYREKATRVTGTFVPLATLFEPDKPWPVDLRAQSPLGAAVHVKGKIRDVVDFEGYELNLAAKGASFPELLSYFSELDIPDVGAFELNGTVADPDKKIALRQASIRIGDKNLVKVDITGSVKDTPVFEGVDLKFNIEGDEIKRLVKFGYPAPLIPGYFRFTGRIQDPTPGQYRISDFKVTGPDPYKAYGSMAFTGATKPQRLEINLKSDHFVLGPAHLNAEIAGPVARASLENLDFSMGSSETATINLSGKIGNLLTQEGMDLTLAAHGDDLAYLEKLVGQPLPVQGEFSAKGKVQMPETKVFHVPDLQLRLGDCDFSGMLDWDVTGADPLLGVSLSSPRLNLKPMLKRPIKGLPGLTTLKDLGPFHLRLLLARRPNAIEMEKLVLDMGGENLLRLEVTGTAQDIRRLKGVNLRFKAYGRDISQLERLTDKPLPIKGRFAVSAGVVDPESNVYRLDKLSVELGKNKLDGSMGFDFSGQHPRLEGRLSAEMLNLKPLSLPSLKEVPKLENVGSFGLEARLSKRENALNLEQLDVRVGSEEFLDLRLNGSVKNLKSLEGVGLDVEVRGEDVAELEKLLGRPLYLRGPYAVSGRLTDPAVRTFRVENLKLGIGKNALEGSLDAKIAADRPEIALALSGPRFNLEPLAIGEKEILESLRRQTDLGALDVALRLVGEKNTWAVEGLRLKAGSPELAELTLTGNVSDLHEWQRIDLAVSLKGTDVQKLGALVGRPMITRGAYSLSAKVKSPKPQSYEIPDFKMTAGENDLSGRIRVDSSGKRPHIDLDLKSRQWDMRPFLQKAVKEFETSPPEAAKTKRKKVFPDDPIGFEHLSRFDASIKLEAGRLLTVLFAPENVQIRAEIKEGTLIVDPFNFDYGGGSGKGKVRINTEGNTGIIDQQLSVSALDMGPMLEKLGYGRILEGTLDQEFDLSARGDSLAGLMAGLNGEITIQMDQGQIALEYIDMLQGNLQQSLFRLLNPFQKKSSHTDFNCLVCSYDIKDGMAETKMLLDTEQTTLVAAGRINLKTEQLDIGIKPSPKKGYGVKGVGQITLGLNELAKPFKMGGTLVDPQMTIDPGHSMLVLGKALGGFALFGPFGLLAALADVSQGGKDVCLKAIEAARIKKDRAEDKGGKSVSKIGEDKKTKGQQKKKAPPRRRQKR
jgi:hypothetical protein